MALHTMVAAAAKTSGKALSPDNLVRDFAGSAICARQIVSSLYRALGRALDDRQTGAVGGLFEQWQTFFGEVTGYDEGSTLLRHRPAVRRFAREMELDERSIDPPRLFFAVHTYFALLIKLIAYHALSRFAPGFGARFGSLNQLGGSELKHEMEDLERGGIFLALGIRNFLDGDFFQWYLAVWDADVAQAMRTLFERLADYDPGSLEVSPEQSRDLLKKLYHRLMPREIRHDLGEYYTPDWLAENVLDELGYEGQTGMRLLDPACGSGTFLVLAIKRLRERCLREGMKKQQTLETILDRVVGIDLNPLAAVAARTNYLLALGDLVADRRRDIEIPVYRGDSILSFASGRPAVVGQFDFIAGNPPWIGWESLPDEYRARTQPLWIEFGLFPHDGMDTILGKGKKDLSMLMSYSVTKQFLKTGGRLGFLITQSVFKTSGASDGFRRFRLGDGPGDAVRVLGVHDFSDFQAFEEASTRASIFVWEKGAPTRYPVPYTVWQKTAFRRPIGQDASLAEATAMTRRLPFFAEPIDPQNGVSAWLTARSSAVAAARKIVGRSTYQAHEGVNSGGNNGVFWVEVIGKRPDGTVVVRNLAAGAKRQVTVVDAEIEPDLLYPLLRGREVKRWRASHSARILLAQDPNTRRGIEETLMQRQCPMTYDYLKGFENELRGRAAFKRYYTRIRSRRIVETGAFYSMFGVGTYTLSPWKVVWHRMIAPIGAVVVGSEEGKPILPQETHVFVGADAPEEAFYLAGMLNSLAFNFAAMAYSQAGGKSFGSPHILENLHIPKFQAGGADAVRVAELARGIQEDFPSLDNSGLAARERLLDEATALLWGIDSAALAEIRKDYRELTKADLRESHPQEFRPEAVS